MTAGDALERAFAGLDRLPTALFSPTVVHPIGSIDARIEAVHQWRTALLQGRVPHDVQWPAPGLHHAIATYIRDLGVLQFTAGNPELVEQLLVDLLQTIASLPRTQQDLIAELLAAARAKERRDWEEPSTLESTGGGSSTDVEGSRVGEARGGEDDDAADGELDVQRSGETPGISGQYPSPAVEIPTTFLDHLSDRLDATWRHRVQQWQRLSDVLGDLSLALALDYDLANRTLRHVGWREVERLMTLLDDLPQVHDIVQTLGRMSVSGGQEQHSVVDTIADPIRRTTVELRERRSPEAPTEARGIERSSDITKMLPTEAALLTHPILRRLWHARRAEAALASYQFEGTIQEWVTVQVEAAPEQKPGSRVPNRGPVILCLDTSGSMQGAPEQVAKALTLAITRAAHDEGRDVHVILFSGPGDIERLTVSLTPDGVSSLLRLLAMSFHGGTDVDYPVRVALDMLFENRWSNADLLIVSDGAFDVSPALLHDIHTIRESNGNRVHGLLIGVQQSEAMESMCEPLHVFADWAAVGGVDGRL